MNNALNHYFDSVPKNASIGLLGGSFDPPHLGHAFLALSFLALEAIDELWIIPCNDHAFKKNMISFEHRFAMCLLAFGHFQKTRVLDIEKKIEAPNYSIATIMAIKKERPDLALSMCLGSDIINEFPTWHRAKELSQSCRFVIFRRGKL